jgi:hypothetical protein
MRGPYRTKHFNDKLLIKDLSRQRQRHQYNILSLHIEVNIYLTYKYVGLSMIVYFMYIKKKIVFNLYIYLLIVYIVMIYH